MLFLVTVAVLMASANAYFYRDCGSTATIEMVFLNGCLSDSTACLLKDGTNATINLVFTPNADVSGLSTTVDHRILSGVYWRKLPLPEDDVCQASGITCPIKGGETVGYRTTLPIPDVLIPTMMYLKFKIEDSDGKVVVCFQMKPEVRNVRTLISVRR